jgi:hypothetical protein
LSSVTKEKFITSGNCLERRDAEKKLCQTKWKELVFFTVHFCYPLNKTLLLSSITTCQLWMVLNPESWAEETLCFIQGHRMGQSWNEKEKWAFAKIKPKGFL